MSEEPLPQIEKGIPIETRKGRKREDCVANIVGKMEIGDSVVATQKQRNGMFAASVYYKVKLLSRTQQDGTIRIWRIK
jgi:hypothetical protein